MMKDVCGLQSYFFVLNSYLSLFMDLGLVKEELVYVLFCGEQKLKLLSGFAILNLSLPVCIRHSVSCENLFSVAEEDLRKGHSCF
jgi:hypothetical protein